MRVIQTDDNKFALEGLTAGKLIALARALEPVYKRAKPSISGDLYRCIYAALTPDQRNAFDDPFKNGG